MKFYFFLLLLMGCSRVPLYIPIESCQLNFIRALLCARNVLWLYVGLILYEINALTNTQQNFLLFPIIERNSFYFFENLFYNFYPHDSMDVHSPYHLNG